MKNATGGRNYDFKRRGTQIGDENYNNRVYHYRGMLFASVDGFSQGADSGTTTFASARDFGNAAAGYVAGRRAIPWAAARTAFDGLQTAQDGNWRSGWHVEAAPTQKAERVGHNAGMNAYHNAVRKIQADNSRRTVPFGPK